MQFDFCSGPFGYCRICIICRVVGVEHPRHWVLEDNIQIPDDYRFDGSSTVGKPLLPDYELCALADRDPE